MTTCCGAGKTLAHKLSRYAALISIAPMLLGAASPDLSPQTQERVICSIEAATYYQIPANILLAVAEKEAGKPGQWVRNTNGTYDVGSLQFNTSYLSELAQYGIRPEHVAASGCYPYRLAAWRIRMHIRDDSGDLWTRVANYHSRTPHFNAIYRQDVIAKAARWSEWLQARFRTDDLLKNQQVNSQINQNTTKEATVPLRQPMPANYVPRALVAGR